MSCLPGKHFISNFELSPVHDVLWPVCSFQAISVHIVLINLFFFHFGGLERSNKWRFVKVS